MPTESKLAAPEFDLIDADGGRGYIAHLFKTVLRRHDYRQYITERLAGDFACTLAQHFEDIKAREMALQQRLTAADERADVLELDAARYRWLRDPDNQEDLEPDSDYLMPPIICGYAEHEDILSLEALDKAIDSAMSEAPKP